MELIKNFFDPETRAGRLRTALAGASYLVLYVTAIVLGGVFLGGNVAATIALVGTVGVLSAVWIGVMICFAIANIVDWIRDGDAS